MRFSQRIGKTSSVKLAQIESIDKDLTNSLWSILNLIYFDNVVYERNQWGRSRKCNLTPLLVSLNIHLFKRPIDEIPLEFSSSIFELREWFFKSRWFDIFDFIEACADYGPDQSKQDFINGCNTHLKKENSAYRFVNGKITEITSKEEIDSVESAINSSSNTPSAKEHLQSALLLMNDRQNPDYRNSIKESISAVEAIARELSKNEHATLGQALKILEKNGHLHQALKTAFSALYGYTSDANGIRHALMEESKLTKADAKFMLVSCSCFINYLNESCGNE